MLLASALFAALVALVAYVGARDSAEAKQHAADRLLRYGTVTTRPSVPVARHSRRPLIIAAVLGAVGIALIVGGVQVALGHEAPTMTDAGCMRLVANNDLALDSHKADWISNYHGCQQVYDGPTLVGYGVGDGLCNRAAYVLSMRLRLTGSLYHTAMGYAHCVLHEDWSWSAE